MDADCIDAVETKPFRCDFIEKNALCGRRVCTIMRFTLKDINVEKEIFFLLKKQSIYGYIAWNV